MASEDRIVDLEIRISFMERHLEQLDRVLLEVRSHIDLFGRELESLREQQLGQPNKPEDEVPPHW